MALPLVLITMVVLGLLGGAVLQYGVTDATQVARDYNRSKAYYAARSGADVMAEYLIKNPSQVVAAVNKTNAVSGATGSLSDGSMFNVNVEGTIQDGIAIVARGTSNGVSQSVRLDVNRMNPADIFDDAIYTYSNLDISQMKTILGDVTSAGSITFDSDYGNSEYTASPNTYKYFPSPEIPILSTDPILGLNVEVDSNQTETISGSYHYSSISMSPNSSLVFNLPNDTMRVIVDNLETKGSVFINASGVNSRLELFVTNYASISTPLLLNDGDPNRLIIILADGATLDMIANSEVNGFIYGPNATVAMQSAFSQVNGAIISNVFWKMPNGVDKSIGNVKYVKMNPSWDHINSIVVLRRTEWRDVQ
jgi:hypothetical protein